MIRCLTAILLILAAFVPALAASVHADSAAVTTPQVPAQKERVSELAFYEASHSRPLFSWGAEAGANVYLSGNDRSTIALNLATGLRWRWIRFFGLGAEADITVSNSNRYFPIYAIFRTNFTDKPSRVFWEVRGGLALQYHENAANTTGAFFYTGASMLLASGASFSSYMSLGYTYVQRKSILVDEETLHQPNLSNASLRIGVVF